MRHLETLTTTGSVPRRHSTTPQLVRGTHQLARLALWQDLDLVVSMPQMRAISAGTRYDRLLVNDGSGHFTDMTETQVPSVYQDSGQKVVRHFSLLDPVAAIQLTLNEVVRRLRGLTSITMAIWISSEVADTSTR
jgi:hypothetical protein